MVEGQQLYIDFDGGFNHPRRQNGSYSTANPKIQAALEKHPRFKSDFGLVKIIQLDSPIIQAHVVTPTGDTIGVPQGSKVIEPEPVPEPEPEAKDDQYISRVKNGQDAKMELNRKFKIPWSRLKNLAQVKSEAAKLNIVYANWK